MLGTQTTKMQTSFNLIFPELFTLLELLNHVVQVLLLFVFEERKKHATS